MRSPFTKETKCCTCGLSVGFSAAQSSNLADMLPQFNHQRPLRGFYLVIQGYSVCLLMYWQKTRAKCEMLLMRVSRKSIVYSEKNYNTYMLSSSCMYRSSPPPPSTSWSNFRMISFSNCRRFYYYFFKVTITFYCILFLIYQRP